MEYRVGTCNKCGKQWKLPASFQGERAKPRQEDCLKLPEEACDGVVEVGPVVSDAPGSAAEPAMEEVPVQPKKREGPSMKERLLAQRKAEAEAAAGKARPVPASKPASKPAAKAAGKPAATGRKAAPAAGKKAAAPAAKGRAAKASSEDDAAAPARGRAGARKGGGARSGAGKASGGRRGEGGSSRRRPAPDKKKSPAPLIGVIALAALGGVAAWQFLGGGDEAPDQTLAAGPGQSGAEGDSAPAQDAATTTGSPEGTDSSTPAPEPAEEQTAPEAEAPTGETPAPEAPAVDVDSVDLSVLEPYGAFRGTEGEWQDIQELVDTSVDPMAGAAGNRAKTKLVEMGRAAMPALVNKLISFDFSTEQGFRDGDLVQRTMMDICNGTNVGWQYSTEPKDVLFNKKAARLWHEMWGKAAEDDAYWAKMAKLEKVEEAAPAEEPAVDEADLSDLEDLMGGG